MILRAGGSIHAGDPVARIVVEDRQVQRVVTQQGKEYAGDWYISDIHPCALLPLLPEKTFLKSYRDRLCEIPNSYSSFSVYIKFKQGAHRPFANHVISRRNTGMSGSCATMTKSLFRAVSCT